jgi:hypothetical protein
MLSSQTDKQCHFNADGSFITIHKDQDISNGFFWHHSLTSFYLGGKGDNTSTTMVVKR